MVVVVLMGVCGSGKTTIGKALASKLGCSFRDADEFHSDKNKSKMSAGVPLTDEDRIPWLMAIYHYTKSLQETSQTGVVTCSALKRWYRDLLRTGMHKSSVTHSVPSSPSPGDTDNCTQSSTSNILGPSCVYALQGQSPQEDLQQVHHSKCPESSCIFFVLLNGSKEVLAARLAGRTGHFMPPELLNSQLEILEEPSEDENCLVVNIDDKVIHIVDIIFDRVKQIIE